GVGVSHKAVAERRLKKRLRLNMAAHQRDFRARLKAENRRRKDVYKELRSMNWNPDRPAAQRIMDVTRGRAAGISTENIPADGLWFGEYPDSSGIVGFGVFKRKHRRWPAARAASTSTACDRQSTARNAAFALRDG